MPPQPIEIIKQIAILTTKPTNLHQQFHIFIRFTLTHAKVFPPNSDKYIEANETLALTNKASNKAYWSTT